ncbi:MAG: glycosyltransferase family 39 protein [Imperialibacter sp.]|uniref:ArnT family glycosyltransferase n=1 Tax=Imperialibacter sp. TaxID=2038411 RepID=UPI0032EDC20A
MKNRLWVIVMAGLLSYGWNFWGTSIYFLDEAKNAQCAAEMLETGDFFVPRFNGQFHDKPVLQYVFMMGAYQVFGINSFSARLFSVLFGVLMLVVVFQFVKKLLNEKVAFYAALILAASLQMSWQFRMAAPDPYLLFLLTLGMLSFFYGYQTHKSTYLYVFYLCIGLGFVTKGPIAYALPGLSVVVFLLLNRDFSWQRIVSLRAFEGIVLSLALGLPWYVGTGLATNWEWPEYFFITHNISRYTNTFEGHHGFPFDGVVIVIAALLPLSVFLPQAFFVGWKERKQQPFLLFSISVFIAVIGFFFFSQTVLPSYPAPCMPFVAVLLGYFLAKLEEEKSWHRFRPILNAFVYLIISIALPVAAWIAFHKVPELKQLSPGYSLVFVIASLGGVLGLWFIHQKKMSSAFYSYTASFVVLLMLVFQFPMPALDRLNPVTNSLALIESYNKPIVHYRRINPAYVFNLHRIVPDLHNEEELDDFIREHGSVIVISAEKEWRAVKRTDMKQVFEGRYLFEPPKVIVMIKE